MSSTGTGQYDIETVRGTTFSWAFTINTIDVNGTKTPYDFTGKHARLTVRGDRELDAAVALIAVTDATSAITLGGALGTVRVTLSSSFMSGIAPGKYAYNFDVYDNAGVTIPLLAGDFTVFGNTNVP